MKRIGKAKPDWAAQVESACAGSGLQLTRLRRQVLDIIAKGPWSLCDHRTGFSRLSVPRPIGLSISGASACRAALVFSTRQNAWSDASQPRLLAAAKSMSRASRSPASRILFNDARNRLLVSDLGSTLGTMVNGRAIGHHFMRDAEPLHRGENHVVAGGKDSPFKFSVFIS